MSEVYSRSQRVADQIQKYLAALIQQDLKDPRVGMVTITSVVVSKEYDIAKIYFSTFNLDGDSDETLAGLTQAAGYLRSALAKRLKIRTTPKLRFVVDESIEYGNRLSTLINDAMDEATDNIENSNDSSSAPSS